MKEQNSSNQEQSINLNELLNKYLIHAKWFVLSVLMCLAIAFVYLRYATPEYSVSATLLIKDDKKGGLMSELSNFSDIGLLGGSNGNVDNEIEILKSRTLVEKTVKDLNLNLDDVESYNIDE